MHFIQLQNLQNFHAQIYAKPNYVKKISLHSKNFKPINYRKVSKKGK